MTNPLTAPYGAWKSPITPDLIVEEAVRLGMITLDGSDIYWIEGRPAEQGRNVVVRRTADGTITSMTPPGFNVRTRVHEYGGGDFIADQGTVYFTNFGDQQLYRQDGSSTPVQITPTSLKRYADPVIDRGRQRLIC